MIDFVLQVEQRWVLFVLFFPKDGLPILVFFSKSMRVGLVWFRKSPKAETMASDISDFYTKPKISTQPKKLHKKYIPLHKKYIKNTNGERH